MLVEMQSHSSLENNLASCCETEHLHTLLKNFIPEWYFRDTLAYMDQKTYRRVFTAASLITAKREERTRYSLVGKWVSCGVANCGVYN